MCRSIARCIAVISGVALTVSVSAAGQTLSFKNTNSGRCIGVDRASTSSGAYIKQFTCDNFANQDWTLKGVGGGIYNLDNRKSNKCMGVNNASTDPGADIRQFTCDGSTNQKWRLGKASIVNRKSGLCIGVDGGSTANGAQLKQFECDGRPNQGWDLYQRNLFHFQARHRFFDSAPAKDDAVDHTSVGRGPDQGIVVARGFIRNKDLISDAIGDDRQFSNKPFTSSKIAVAWDTATGEVGVYVQKSCVPGLGCKDALPVKFVPDATDFEKDFDSLFNAVSVNRTGADGLRVAVSAMNSHGGSIELCVEGPACFTFDLGRIDAQVLLERAGGALSARLAEDRFPAWEIIRYPTKVQAQLQAQPKGQAKVVGTRDQTTIGDLTSGARSSCRSVPPEEGAKPTNDMSC